MIPLAPLLAVLAAVGPGVPWTRDYVKAFSTAEEHRRPVLLFFRTECGGGNLPQNPIELGGAITHQEGHSDCDLMNNDVWENRDIVDSSSRFVPVMLEGGDRTLHVRYQAVRMPTTLVTDPWGNEILRVSGYFPRDKMQRLLSAIPADFSALEKAGKTLQSNPQDFEALTGAAAFYEGARLPQVVERMYGLALNTPRAAVPVDNWRKAVIARGVNLLLALGNPGTAASLFEAEVAAAPEAPGTDALLLGVVNARLQQGNRKLAQAAVRTLETMYPKSPYAQRARQNLDATAN